MKRSCDNCPYGGVKVTHRGPLDSPLVIVGDGPQPIELARKTAFFGPVGEMIESMLKKGGFTDVEPLYIHAIECFPRDKVTGRKKVKDSNGVLHTVDGGKQKYAQAIVSCRNRLLDILAEHPRRMIIALGAGALQSLQNDLKIKITHKRGGVIEDGLSEKGTFPVLHPSTLMKGGGSYQQYQADFVTAWTIYSEGLRPQFYDATYTTLTTPSQVRVLAKYLRKHPEFLVAADIETGSLDFWNGEILELGVTWNGRHGYIIPEHLLTDEIFQNECKFLWHNGKFDLKFFWHNGMPSARVDHDTMMISYALDETKGRHGLEQVAWDWLGAPDYKDMLKPYLPTKDTSYREIPTDVRHKYLAMDIGRTWQLFAPMMEVLKTQKGPMTAYEHILIPGSNYLARVEFNGFLTDRQWVKEHMDKMEEELATNMAEFQKLAIESWGKEVNTNSPMQLQAYLYGHLKLAHPLTATDRDTLETLPEHPCLTPLLRIRKLQKYLSTYVYPCWNRVDSAGRIHASYNLHGTKTGRLSSNGPNMQNIPRFKEVRGMFIAEDGKVLIECDLSQAELRSLAVLSGDEELCRIYNSDELSLHDEVTAEIFPGYTDPEVSKEEKKEMKMRGKAVNFGIVYGRQAHSFMAEFNISMAEAQHWIAKWFARFPKGHRFIQKCREAVDKGQTLNTVFGRRRRFGVITPERRTKLKNEASNFPHQSTASDITLLAGIRCEPILRNKYGAKVVNTVHDCIVIEADPQYKDEICRLVTGTMVQIPKEWGLTKVPFESEAEQGVRWGHLEGYHDFMQKEEDHAAQ